MVKYNASPFPPKPACEQPKGLDGYLGCARLNPVLSSSHIPGEPPALSIHSISTQAKRKRALSSRMESHQAPYASVALVLASKQIFRRAPKVCPHLNHCSWNSTGTGSLGILYHSKIFVLSSLAALPAPCQTHLAT